MPVGYPGDSDPKDEVPEWECPHCGGVVVRVKKSESECLDCNTIFEPDCEPTE
jgi:predicted RNA-binding Zn-ribbon protein involved in translation (DUF1610 family)